MFKKARIKLTLWYLAIILSISLSFSFILYKGTVREVERFARMQRLRIERQRPPFELPDKRVEPTLNMQDELLVREIKTRILITLGMVNGMILIVAGALGYFLAGKTLEPIQYMLDEQNRFISDASHELKTPLTSLKTSLEVFMRGKNQSVKDATDLIKESIEEVNRLQLLSEGLLQMTQYEKPRNHLKKEQVKFSSVIVQAIKKIKPLADKKNITIETKIDNVTVNGNTYALMDLCLILLDNAVKYADASSVITVSVRKEKHGSQFDVINTGIGISEKDLPHVFDRFYRADEARTNKDTHGGYGLGLSIAQKISAFHNAHIKIKSKNRTTKVTVRFFS